jgi:hypothetical protein
LSVPGAPSGTGSATFPVGHRSIDGRTGAHTYAVGTATYFSETINYSIEPDKGYEAILSPLHGLSFRLVAMLDPASNTWVVDNSPASGTTFDASNATPTGVTEQFAATPLDALTGPVSAAQQRALDAQEQQIVSAGLLAHGTDLFVVVSPRSGLAFALIPHVFEQSTQAQAMQECAGFATPSYRNWHLATQAEFINLISTNGIIDTPDGRFWRSGASVVSGGWRDIVLAPDPSLPTNVPEWETNNVGTGQINGWVIGQTGMVPRPFLAMCVTVAKP